MSEIAGINPQVPPSGPGCVECDAAGGWWFHLRRCAECGHIGCCDTSPSQHGSAHARDAGHPFITSFEPGENWFWSFATDEFYDGPVARAAGASPARSAGAGAGRTGCPPTGSDTCTDALSARGQIAVCRAYCHHQGPAYAPVPTHSVGQL